MHAELLNDIFKLYTEISFQLTFPIIACMDRLLEKLKDYGTIRKIFLDSAREPPLCLMILMA